MSRLLPDIHLPDVIEEIDYEALLDDTKQHLRDESGLDIEFIESDPVTMANESLVYREMLLRARINESARAAYLFTASNNDLKNIASSRGVILLDGESDERLRYRTYLALYSFSTAGAAKSYEYYALTVSTDILQARCLGPKDGTAPGTVEIVYHSNSDFTDDVLAACNDETVVPLCDTPLVTRAEVLNVDITIDTLDLEDGYTIADTRTRIEEAFYALNSAILIGDYVSKSRIYDTASVNGVIKVTHDQDDVIATARQIIQFNIIFI